MNLLCLLFGHRPALGWLFEAASLSESDPIVRCRRCKTRFRLWSRAVVEEEKNR